MGAAHFHGVFQLRRQFLGQHTDSFRTGAVHRRYIRTGNDDRVRPDGQCFENIHAGTDSAVYQNLHLTLHRIHDFRQHFCRRRTLVQHPAAVVGYHNSGSAGGFCLQGAFHRHDAFYDKRHAGVADNFSQFFFRFGTCRRVQLFQKRKAGPVHIHGAGKSAAVFHAGKLLLQRFRSPGFYGGNAQAAGFFNGPAGRLHHRGVGAVAGHGYDAFRGTAGNQHVVIGGIRIGIAVMYGHQPYRSGDDGVFQAFAEKVQAHVHGLPFHQRVHIDADLLPLFIIADRRIPDALGARSGHFVPAGAAVTDQTAFAVCSQPGTGLFHQFHVIHDASSS